MFRLWEQFLINIQSINVKNMKNNLGDKINEELKMNE